MNNNVYLSIIRVFILCANLAICEDFTEICERNNEIIPVQAFRVNNIAVLFVTLDGETKAIRIKLSDKIFDNKFYTNVNIKDVWPELNSDDIMLWQDWNRHKNGTIIKDIDGFISVYRMKQNLVQNDINDNSLIFITHNKEYLDAKYTIGYHVKYDTDVKHIVFVSTFHIDPYRAVKEEDVFNLRSLYAHFPSDSQQRITPIVTYYLPSSPRRAFVYYNELKPKKPSENNYKIHFMIQNRSSPNDPNDKMWIYDVDSSECIRKTNETYLVNAAFDLTDVKSITMSSVKYMITIVEFYNNGKYGKMSVLLKDSGAVYPDSVNNIDTKYNVRDIICKPVPITTPPLETTAPPFESPSSGQSTYDQSGSKKSPLKRASNSSKYVMLLIIVISMFLTVAVITLFCCFKSRKNSNQKDEISEEIESKEITEERTDGNSEEKIDETEQTEQKQEETVKNETQNEDILKV